MYMYDGVSLNQDLLLPLAKSYKNFFLLSIAILLCYILLFMVSTWQWSQLVIILILTSTTIFNMFFVESYQFFYILTIFFESNWVYNEELNSWALEYESPKLRAKQYYFIMCLIAKYWHFLFIFLSWVFFIMKSFERRKITITLLALNFQNLLILYVLNLICYIQWLKWLFRRFLDEPYYWFFTHTDSWTYKTIFEEVYFCLNTLAPEKLTVPGWLDGEKNLLPTISEAASKLVLWLQ